MDKFDKMAFRLLSEFRLIQMPIELASQNQKSQKTLQEKILEERVRIASHYLEDYEKSNLPQDAIDILNDIFRSIGFPDLVTQLEDKKDAIKESEKVLEEAYKKCTN